MNQTIFIGFLLFNAHCPPVTAVWRVDWRLSHCTFVLLYPLFITVAIAHVNKVKIRVSPLKVGISYKPEKNF